jgi:hypothetical protein
MERPTGHVDGSVWSWWIRSIQCQVPPGLLTDTLIDIVLSIPV